MIERLHAIVRGRVQMVMYRDFATRKARGLGLVGTVQNLPDGTVQVVAEGDKAALEAYIQKLERGPMLARVEKVEVSWLTPMGEFADFTILF